MALSFKDIQFIIEAIDRLIEKYQERLNEIEDINEDEASDLGNNTMFLESLRRKLANSLNNSTNAKAFVVNEAVQASLDTLLEDSKIVAKTNINNS
ncbi:MAG: hypothetical protein RMX96_27575 [Nostoc sp. ChiSLP02]|nr:hypothetical protein [Nostoc sp. DedSLP05]MDZ8098328.1 hypothetical protein [Nostoc sp. DedSLP01]MDZ8188602.1 hypothetical protein [Nostoc sp. ChiSLP02]